MSAIIGIGTDIVEVPRIAALLKKQKARFVARILHPQELPLPPFSEEKQAALLAKRFAVKEAFAKAIGTGIGAECSFQDLIVTHDKAGRPLIHCSDALAARLKLQYGNVRFHCTIADTANHATATVVAERLTQE